MVIQLDEVRKARKREYHREYYQANKEKVRARRQANKEKVKARRQADKEKILNRNRKWRQANKEKIAERDRAYYEANKKEIADRARAYREANKAKVAERKRAYREANKEKIAERNRAYYEAKKKKVIAGARRRYAIDDAYCLAAKTRTRIKGALRASGLKKSTRTIKLLGCNWEAYRKWIESHFTDGMSWENQDDWHVDHTYPVMPALQQFGEAALPVVFNYRNCKPMWAAENFSKNATIPPDDEIHPWVRERLALLENFGQASFLPNNLTPRCVE
jgi:hypothetical protein